MEHEHSYLLTGLPRLFDYPYRLEELGWLPHHCHWHNHAVADSCFVCLSCNFTGDSEILVNGKLHRSEPGQLPAFSLLLPGVELHTLREEMHDELFFRYSAECTPHIVGLLRPALGLETSFYFQGFPQDTLAEMRHILNDLQRPGNADLLDQLAVRLMTEIVSRRMNLHAESGAHSVRLHTIAAGLRQGQPLEKLLRIHGYSERTFYREWKRLFGVSPRQYVLGQRMEHACSMLAGSSRPISVIAEECGFGSTTYFHHIFQAKLKMTPLAFRKKHSKELFASVEIPLLGNNFSDKR